MGLPIRWRTLQRRSEETRAVRGGKGTDRPEEGVQERLQLRRDDDYYARLRGVIDGTGIDSKGERYPGPPDYFMRWNVEITPKDIENFKVRCLNPLLEQLCDWWDWIDFCQRNKHDRFSWSAAYGLDGDFEYQSLHWVALYGTYNPLLDGGGSEYDNYLRTGNSVGLRRVETLFPELQDGTDA